MFRIGIIICIFFFSGLKVWSHNDDTLTIDTTQLSDIPKVILKTNPIFPILWGPIVFTSEYRMVAEIPLKSRETLSFMASYLGENLLVDINDSLPRNDVDRIVIDANGDEYAWEVNKIEGYRLQFLYKHYIGKQTSRGFYMGPHLSYSLAKFMVDWQPLNNSSSEFPEGGNPTDYLSISYFNFNAIAGYQFFAGRFIAFDMFGGLGVNQRSLISSYEAPAFDNRLKDNSGIVPKLILGFTLGIAIY